MGHSEAPREPSAAHFDRHAVEGRSIQASTRGTDLVGRVGGDEFAVLLAECVDPRPAIDRVFVALHDETTGGAQPQKIRVSIGAATESGVVLG